MEPSQSNTLLGSWFSTEKITDYLYLTTEPKFFIGNRSNCWLIKGPGKDVLIDTGLGVCDIREHLESINLISPPGGDRECDVICTHVHFDHSGGARHFKEHNVYLHREDTASLIAGRQTETLNYVKPPHFLEQPYSNFNANHYKVPPTPCQPLQDGNMIDIGGGEHLEIIHTPGHTKGSICIYYPAKRALFSGDFVYDSGSGEGLLDWLPTSCVKDYVHSANSMLDFISDDKVGKVYPGHFNVCSSQRIKQLLGEYVDTKDNCCSVGCASCLQCTTWCFFLMGCFRCCPCSNLI